MNATYCHLPNTHFPFKVRVWSPEFSILCYILWTIPKVSKLGHFLFLLYINNFPNCYLLSNARMYADNTNLTLSAHDHELFSAFSITPLIALKQWPHCWMLIVETLTSLKTKSEQNVCLLGTDIKFHCFLIKLTLVLKP